MFDQSSVAESAADSIRRKTYFGARTSGCEQPHGHKHQIRFFKFSADGLLLVGGRNLAQARHSLRNHFDRKVDIVVRGLLAQVARVEPVKIIPR